MFASLAAFGPRKRMARKWLRLVMPPFRMFPVALGRIEYPPKSTPKEALTELFVFSRNSCEEAVLSLSFLEYFWGNLQDRSLIVLARFFS